MSKLRHKRYPLTIRFIKSRRSWEYKDPILKKYCPVEGQSLLEGMEHMGDMEIFADVYMDGTVMVVQVRLPESGCAFMPRVREQDTPAEQEETVKVQYVAYVGGQASADDLLRMWNEASNEPKLRTVKFRALVRESGMHPLCAPAFLQAMTTEGRCGRA